jgi:hypothetical protein
VKDATVNHRFVLEIWNQDSTSLLHQQPVESFLRLVNHARFDAVCAGVPDSESERVTVSPVWLSGMETPYVKSVAITVQGPKGHEPLVKEYGLHCFSVLAQSAGQTLLACGVLKANEQFVYRISAYPVGHENTDDETDRPRRRFQTSLAQARVSCVEQPVARFLEGEHPHQEAPFDVYVAEQVLNDIREQAKLSEDKEQGGFLIGYLGRDTGTGRVFLRVTAQAQALDGVHSTCTSFQFSEQTFLAAQQSLSLRRRPEEAIVGWQHSHTWCAKCTKRDQCSASTVFWSLDDQRVMDSAFPQPFQVGLVLGLDNSNTTEPHSFEMYGWQDAVMVKRRFRVIEEGVRYAEV